MAGITSMGVGSGIDIQSLVKQLVAAEGQPVTNRLNRQESRYQAQLSAIGTIKGSLSSFRTATAALMETSAFSKFTATSANTDLFTATVSSGVAATYEVEVRALAQAHKLASVGFADATSSVGTGTLTFQFGDPTKPAQTVTIGSGINTLEGIRDAVNAAKIGVRASVINGDSGYQLVFASENGGLDNALKITVADDDGNNTDAAGLSRLAYDTGAGVTNMSQTAVAQDALVYIDGVAVTRSSNTISDAIDGVTLTLKKEAVGTNTALTIAADTSGATSAVESFVTSFNKLISTFKAVAGYDATTKTGGILMGDASVRGLESQLRRVISSAVDGLSGSYTSLSELGISTQTNGSLLLDKTKLESALKDSSDAVARVFAKTGVSSDSLINYSASTADTVAGEYAVDISTLATRGVYTGVAATTTTVSATNKTFTIKVDGVSSGTVTLNEGVYTGSALAAEIQSRINGDSSLETAGVSVTVGYDGSGFTVTSERYGSASKVQFLSVGTTFAADFGLDVGAGTDGVDVAGTLGGITATGSGRTLTADSGDPEGLAVEVRGGALGSRGNLVFSRGVADQLDTLLGRLLEADGLLDSRTDGLSARIDDITEQRTRLTERLAMVEQRYIKQFTAMDALVAQLNSTGSFLTQQITSLSNLNGG